MEETEQPLVVYTDPAVNNTYLSEWENRVKYLESKITEYDAILENVNASMEKAKNNPMFGSMMKVFGI